MQATVGVRLVVYSKIECECMHMYWQKQRINDRMALFCEQRVVLNVVYCVETDILMFCWELVHNYS